MLTTSSVEVEVLTYSIPHGQWNFEASQTMIEETWILVVTNVRIRFSQSLSRNHQNIRAKWNHFLSIYIYTYI